MKNFILYFFLFFCTFSFAQVSDTLLPNQSGDWNIKTWQYDGWSLSGGYYGTEGYSIYGSFVWNDTTWTFISVNGSDGLMRSDSGKVYCRGKFDQLPLYYAPTDTSEKLLYDFTMEIGDTAYYDDLFPIKVEGIGTSDILGITEKAWFLSNSDTIVQGLGSIMGLFRPWKSMFEAKNWICSFNGYYKDTTGTITNLAFSTSACVLSMKEDEREDVKTKCGFDKIWISSQEPTNLSIYSYDGKFIYEIRINSGETILDIDFLERGAYILRLGAIHSEKFIKG